jgi:RNA polymerase sigma-70 factor (ECF subfamily)
MTMVTDERALWLARCILPHEPALRAWLNRQYTGDLEVDDIVQEAYAVLVTLADVRHITAPRNYLFQTCKSLILMHLRRSRVVSIRSVGQMEEFGFASAEPTPERQVADREELHNLAVAIAALPPRCRDAFTLRRVEGLSQREVAHRLGVSENTVEKHVGKAIRYLMDVFGHGGKRPAGASKDSGDLTRPTDVETGNQLGD